MMLGPGDIAKVIEAAGTIVKFVQKAKNPNLLSDFAKLMQQEDSPERQEAILQFFQDRLQELGFTPWYEYAEPEILVPKDMLPDIVDLLVAGTTAQQKGGWLGGMFGGDKAKGDRLAWSEAVHEGNHAHLLAVLEDIVNRCGRVRAYSPRPAIGLDPDMVADIGMALIG